MVTPGVPPIPHVGGPISGPGVPTVLIGGMPAACLGDMAVCVGPPATIIMGCPTVMIGPGGGGGGGGGAGSSGAGSATTSAKQALTDNIESTTKDEHWIEFELVDKAGNLISGIPYKLKDTESKESKSVVRLDGKIRRDSIKDGEAEVQLFHLSNAEWSKSEAEIGEKVKLTSDVEGFEDDTKATVSIFKKDIKRADFVFITFESSVQGGKIEVEWEFVLPDDQDEEVKSTNMRQEYSTPQYYFEVVVEMCKARSGLLKFKDWMEIELKDEEGKGFADEEYLLYLSNGEIRRGRLDNNGYKKEEKLPPGPSNLKFPNLSDTLNQ
jgi:hypothetical protein